MMVEVAPIYVMPITCRPKWDGISTMLGSQTLSLGWCLKLEAVPWLSGKLCWESLMIPVMDNEWGHIISVCPLLTMFSLIIRLRWCLTDFSIIQIFFSFCICQLIFWGHVNFLSSNNISLPNDLPKLIASKSQNCNRKQFLRLPVPAAFTPLCLFHSLTHEHVRRDANNLEFPKTLKV